MAQPSAGPANVPHTNPILLVGLPVLAVAIAALALYVALVRAPAQADLKAQQELLLRLTGVTQPVSNSLAERYVDTNGDLVADAPTDPAKLRDPEVVRITYIATDEPEDFQTGFKDLVDAIAKATGRRVEYVPFRSSQEELKALRDGEVHVAGMNTGNVPLAVNVAGFVPVAAVAPDATGDAFVRSVLIVPASSPIRSLSDLRGKALTVTDAGSNSGYRVPLGMLKAAGFLPVRDYELRYSGSHEASIEAIAAAASNPSGQAAQLAAVASDILAREIARGTIRKDQFRELATSEKFPAGTLGLAHDLKPELAEKIRSAIVGFTFKGTSLERALAPEGSFVRVTYKDDFALVRRIDDETGNKHTLQP